jgi:hypothetical protein
LLFWDGAELRAIGDFDDENNGACRLLPGTRAGKRVYGIKTKVKYGPKSGH